jgi:hypothetical protein
MKRLALCSTMSAVALALAACRPAGKTSARATGKVGAIHACGPSIQYVEGCT